ncbi:hypothetical protein GOODEAATRI_026048 [Goodea atripinnis]|uniref:Polycystin domain-containing protein n=1 Tax=Goodea atripinnis TaxID=208336 RepID=A0ABV0PS17_9TELE
MRTGGSGHGRVCWIYCTRIHQQKPSWISRQTVALKVQFTLYSPAPHLFSSVSLITEQRPDGALLHSVKVQSVKVLHTPALWDHVTMVCKVSLLTVTLVCYACFIHHSTMIMEVVSLLQTQHRGHVDVSAVANWEQVRDRNNEFL